MYRAIRLLPNALLALSLLPCLSEAYGAEPSVTVDASLPAVSLGRNAGLFAPESGRLALLPAPLSASQTAAEAGAEARERRNHAWRNRWIVSVAPLVASQSLDAASSWGLREMNPILAGPDGRFGMKATSIKFGVVGGLLGAEYLLVRKFPASAKFFTVVNYTTAGITGGLAAHNYALPGR